MFTEMMASNWVPYYKPSRNAALRLFCFPYAGGGASFYRRWPCYLPESIEVCALQLPGRESRLAEAPCSEFRELVTEVTEVVAMAEMPFAFFGHSMGALLAFACARDVNLRYGKCPTRLFVSARRAPHVPPRQPMLWALPRPELIREVRQLEGTNDTVLASPELMDVYLPAIRADFKVNDTVLEFTPESRLPCPITAFGGAFDPEISHRELSTWSRYTTAEFSLNVFHGGHFYLREQSSYFFECLAGYCLGHG